MPRTNDSGPDQVFRAIGPDLAGTVHSAAQVDRDNRTTDCLNLNQDHAESISYTSSVDVASPSSWRGFKGAAAAGSPRPRLRRWHDGGSDRNYRADGINLRWAQHAVQAAKVGQRGHTARHGRSTSRDHDDAKD